MRRGPSPKGTLHQTRCETGGREGMEEGEVATVEHSFTAGGGSSAWGLSELGTCNYSLFEMRVLSHGYKFKRNRCLMSNRSTHKITQ